MKTGKWLINTVRGLVILQRRKKMTKKINHIKIYQRFLEIKASKGKVGDLLKEFSISRGTLYNAISKVENGDTAALRRCLSGSRLECLWEYKYKTRFLSLPKDRSATTVAELQKIIWEMKADEFPIYIIAEKTEKERSTILYHLAKIK